MEKSTNTFEYKPLDTARKEIRLLILHPDLNYSNLTSEIKDEICCDVIYSSLKNHPRYEALSYCWGDPKVTASIRLKGQSFKVTTNLESALRYLRHPRAYRTLWVDAICINQLNPVERSEQVSIMADIYRSALCCLLWIGPSPVKLGTAPIISRQCHDILLRRYTGSFQDQAKKVADALQRLDRNEYLTVVKDLCQMYTGHQVWRRMWIVQEVVLARDVEVVYSIIAVNWKTVFSVALGFHLISKNPRAKDWQREKATYYSRTFNMLILETRYKAMDGFKQSLMDLYPLAGRLDSSDPKDTIYALLNMADDNLDMKPDYSLDVYNVYCDFALAHITKFNNLDILEHASLETGQSRLGKLPSWIPDPGLHYNFPKPSDPNGQKPGFRAGLDGCKCSFTRDSIYGDPNKLMLFGVLVDEVEEISNTTWIRAWSPQKYGHMFSNGIPEDCSGQYCNGDNKFDAYWRTLMLDTSCSRRLNRGEIDTFRQLFRNIQKPPAPPSWLQRLSKKIARPKTLQRSLQGEIALLKMTGEIQTQPYLFGLTKNGYMAMLPAVTKEHDVICVLYGGRTPFVLRPSPPLGEDTYRLVGPAYVHGFMDGEAITWRDQRRLPGCKFILS